MKKLTPSMLTWCAIIAISALSLLVRLYYVHTVVTGPIVGDATTYYSYAYNLIHQHVFSKAFPGSNELVVADSYRDPAYPVLVALSLWLGGENNGGYRLLLDIQAILGAATVMLMLLVGRRWMSLPWLVVAGCLMALWPHSITITSYVLTETLFGFLTASALALFCALPSRSVMSSFLTGFMFGMASLANAILLPFGIFLAVWLLLSKRLANSMALALALGACLLPGLWSIRNLGIQSQDTVAMTSRGRAVQNFVQGSWPEYHSAWLTSAAGAPAEVSGIQKTDADAVIKRIDDETALMAAHPLEGATKVIARLSAKPLHYAFWYLSKPYLLWDWSIRIGQGDIFVYPVVRSAYITNPVFMLSASLARAINPWLFLLLAGYCVLALFNCKKTDTAKLACVALAAYTTVIYTVLQAEPRYSIPFRPLELLIAMTMLSVIITKLKARMAKRE